MKKKHVALITIMTALSITACGGAKEADTTTEVQQPQAAVETVADVAETEKADVATETVEAVETTEAVETETEASVSADSKFDVKIIGICPFEGSDDVLVFSFTNKSDQDIATNHSSVDNTLNMFVEYPDDTIFRPGETDYGYISASSREELEALTEDEICAELDAACYDMPENENTDYVLYTTEFTSDEFGNGMSRIEEELNKPSYEYLAMYYKNDELVGVTQWVVQDSDGIGFENPYDADRIVVFWCQTVDL